MKNNNENLDFIQFKTLIDDMITNKTIDKLKLQENYFEICKNYWIIDKYIATDGVFEEDMTPNTLTSYELAIKNNYALHIPVQMLDDGSVVCFAHKNLSKVVHGESCYIKTQSLKDVKKLALNDNKDTIPTLEEALETIGNRTPIIVEIINNGMVEKIESKVICLLCKYIQKYNCYNNVAVMSINPETLEYCFKNYPYITRILKSGYFKEKMYGSYKSKKLKKLKYYKITHADFISYSYDMLPCVAVEKHKPVGIIAHSVTSQNQYLSVAEHCDNIMFRNFKPTI